MYKRQVVEGQHEPLIDRMSYENVHEFIDRILIHELDRETNTRKIEIHYSFVGQVETCLLYTSTPGHFVQRSLRDNLSRSCGERANAGTRRRNGAGNLFGESGNGKQNGGNT